MGQNLSSTKEVDTSLNTVSFYRRQEKILLTLWLISAYAIAMIWFTVLLWDRWERQRRRFGLVIEAVVLSTMWPLVFLYLMISDDWDLWRIGRHVGGAGASRDT